MRKLRLLTTSSGERESGMSLIEVVVAIGILGILSTVSLGFYMTSMESASAHQRRELAITVANESMEIIQGWNSNVISATTVSALLTGRNQALVQAQWLAAPAVSGLAQSYPTWDPTATASATQAVPLARTVTRSGTEFTSHVYIGKCFKAITSGQCTKLAAFPSTPPATAPAGTTGMLRVVVVVRWTAGCDSGCSYETSTLIDSSTDLEWNTSG
ncbi:type II secretion system protein [Salinibacterium hongtaonis]|uniref:type II secretion system protein n=1 Tax=Homoserinimonas hongtaonis TaxID=2079791 RepID=UPI000D368A34|nr:type II secretion system protein [Salinibacterium hongtaonis]AWB90011.1 hypothetical protein C2138_11070 [Salinibacterium hongtaonis]